jgi:hypothetical protein
MSTEGSEKRWQHMSTTPYQPVDMPDPEYRIAHALEYLASQLGQINVKLDQVISGRK